MNTYSMPQGHMPLLSYSFQRVNQILKRKRKRNKVPAGQRTEEKPSQTSDGGMRVAIGLGY